MVDPSHRDDSHASKKLCILQTSADVKSLPIDFGMLLAFLKFGTTIIITVGAGCDGFPP
jgi:hypothetical protein